MFGEWNPVPKPQKKEKKPYAGLQTKKPLQAKTELKAKSVLKSAPKLVEKRPKQVQKKKPKKRSELKAIRDGLKIPSLQHRSEFSDKERDKINEAFGGAHCAECGTPYISHHHAKFRSGGGRGVFRNGVPLCKTHHDKCHQLRSYADKWRAVLVALYGEYYYMDKWDLWLMGAIQDPNDIEFEYFMQDQEIKARAILEENQ